MAEVLPLPYRGEPTVPPYDAVQAATSTGINTCLARAAQTFEQYVVGTQQFPDVNLPDLRVTDFTTSDWEDKSSQVLGKYFATRPQLFHQTFGFVRHAWNGRIEVVPLESPIVDGAPTLVVAAPILAKSPGNALALHLVPNTILGAAQPRKNGKPFEVFGDVLVFQKRQIGRRVDLTGIDASVVMRALWDLPSVQAILTLVVKRLGISFLMNQFAWIARLPIVDADDPLLLDNSLMPTSDFMCYEYKTKLCSRSDQHETEACPFGHVRSNGRGDTTLMDVRRPVRDDQVERLYCAELCFEVAPPPSSGEKVVLVGYKSCSRGPGCAYCHSLVEKLYHPDVYRTKACNGCKNPRFCAFWHYDEQRRKGAPRSQNNSRQVTPQASRRASATGEYDDGTMASGAATPRTWPSPHSTPRREREGRSRNNGSAPHSRSSSQQPSPFEIAQQLPDAAAAAAAASSLATVVEEMRTGSITLAQRGSNAMSLIRLPSSLDLRASSITVLHRSGSITAVPHRPGGAGQPQSGHAVLDLRAGSITTMLGPPASTSTGQTPTKRGNTAGGRAAGPGGASAGGRRRDSNDRGDGGSHMDSAADIHSSSLHMPSVTSLLSNPGGVGGREAAQMPASSNETGLMDGGFSSLPYYDYFSGAGGYEDLGFGNSGALTPSSVLRSGAVSPLNYPTGGTYTPPLASQGFADLANSSVNDLVMRGGQYLSGNANAYYAAAAAAAAAGAYGAAQEQPLSTLQQQLQQHQQHGMSSLVGGGAGLFSSQDALSAFSREANGPASGLIQGRNQYGLSDGFGELETEAIQSAPSFQSLLGASGLMAQPQQLGTVMLRLSLPGADYPVDLLGCTPDTNAAELLLTLQAHPDYATQLRHNTAANTLILLQPPPATSARQPLHLRVLRFDGRLADCLSEEAFATAAAAGAAGGSSPTIVAGMLHRVTSFEEDLAAEPNERRPLLRQFARVGERLLSRLADIAELPKAAVAPPGKAGKAAYLRAWLESAFDQAERQGQLWQHVPGSCCFNTGLYCHPAAAPPQPIFAFFEAAQRPGSTGPPYVLVRSRRQLAVGEDSAAGLLEPMLGVRLAWLPSPPEGVPPPVVPVDFPEQTPDSPRRRLELCLSLADPALSHTLSTLGVAPPRFAATPAMCVEEVCSELSTWLTELSQRAADGAASGSGAWQSVEAELEVLEACEPLLVCLLSGFAGSPPGSSVLRVLRREPLSTHQSSGSRRRVHRQLLHHDFVQALLELPAPANGPRQLHIEVHFSGRGAEVEAGQLLWEVTNEGDCAPLLKAVAATAESEWWGPDGAPRVLSHLLQQRFSLQEERGGLVVRRMQRDGAIAALGGVAGQLMQQKRFRAGQDFLVFTTGLTTPGREDVTLFFARTAPGSGLRSPWCLWDVLRGSEAMAAISQPPPPPSLALAPYHPQLRLVCDVEALLSADVHRHWLRSCLPQLPETFWRSAVYGAVFMAMQDVPGMQATAVQRLHPSGRTQFMLPLLIESEPRPTGKSPTLPRLVLLAELHLPGDAPDAAADAGGPAAPPPTGSHYRVVGMLPALAAVIDARAFGRLGPAWATGVLEEAAKADAQTLLYI